MGRGLKEESVDWSKLDPGLSEEGEMAPQPNKLQIKIQEWAHKALAVLKLLLGLTFLAFVYAGSRGFFTKFREADSMLQTCFWSGIVSFIILYLFLYEPVIVYQKGQKILSFIFKFFAPLVKIAPYVLPIYSLLVFASYLVLRLIMDPKDAAAIVVYLGGFSWTLHIVFSAKSLRGRQNDFLMANYIFSFTLIYILDLLFIAFLLSLLVSSFSFVGFFQSSFEAARELWMTVCRQIFVLG